MTESGELEPEVCPHCQTTNHAARLALVAPDTRERLRKKYEQARAMLTGGQDGVAPKESDES